MAHELMTERVRDVGDGLILGFPIETTTVAAEDLETVRLYFFRVASETRYYQRYTSLSSIASGSTTPTNGYDFLGDTGVGSGDDIFRVETDDWHLMHFGFGTRHPDLQVFQAVSPQANGNPAQDRTGQGEDIVPGTDDRGWVSSELIEDRFDPPAFTERVSFRNSSNQSGDFLQWAFFNDGTSQLSGADLDLFFVGRGYKVQPITNPEVQRLMMQTALASIEEPTLDTVFHQVGGVNSWNLGSEEPDSWGNVRQREDAFTATFNVAELGPPWRRGPPGGSPPGRRQVRADSP